jgi:hypothetical protein
VERFDWYKCKFLESAENLKPLIKRNTGRTPSTAIALEIAACLQQGRLFYEAAHSSPLEIKPLQLFYGMLGFSKAMIAAYGPKSLATLPKSHGVTDKSLENAAISELSVKIEEKGTFCEINDVFSSLNRLCYFDSATNPCVIKLPSTNSKALTGLQLSLRDILARIPQLESLFSSTFSEKAQLMRMDLNTSLSEEWTISAVTDAEFTDRNSLRASVERLRSDHPFLKQWSLTAAIRSWGQCAVDFVNVANIGTDEFSEDYLSLENGSFMAKVSPAKANPERRFPAESNLPPLATGYSSEYCYAVSPFKGVVLSEYALHYLAMFILSTLVRYLPQNWVHAVTGAVGPNAPADNQALALIERFLELNSTSFPQLVVMALNPHEDKYA